MDLGPKQDNNLRLVLQNVNGLPSFSNAAENQAILDAFRDTKANIYAMTETNTHWRNLKEKNKLYQRMSPWFETLHQALVYNTTE